jgi:hypothetical protein
LGPLKEWTRTMTPYLGCDHSDDGLRCPICADQRGFRWDDATENWIALRPLPEKHRLILVPFEHPADLPRNKPLPNEVFVRYREQLHEANFSGLGGTSPVRRLLFKAQFPPLEDTYHWFVTFDCGCTRDILTRSEYSADLLGRSDDYFGIELPAGQWICDDKQCAKPRKYTGGPVRDIAEWKHRHDKLHVSEPLTLGGRTLTRKKYATWDVELSCAHQTSALTKPGWKPENGPVRSTTKPKVSLAEFLTAWDEDDHEYWTRLYNERFPKPTPFVRCDACFNVRTITSYRLIGPLARKEEAAPKPTPPPLKRSTVKRKLREAEARAAELRKQLKDLD